LRSSKVTLLYVFVCVCVRARAWAVTERVSVLMFTVCIHAIINILVVAQLENCRQCDGIWWDPLPSGASSGFLGAVGVEESGDSLIVLFNYLV